MASLAEALFSLPTDRLRALVLRRGVDPKKLGMSPGKRQLVQTIAQDLSRPQSIAAAITQCNARELRLLQLLTLCQSGNMAAWERLEQAAGGAGLRSALEPIITRLEDWGLAFQMAGSVFLPEPVQALIPVSLPDRYPLAKCLENYDAQTVRRIASNLDLRPERETKGAALEAILETLMDGGTGLRLKTPLDREEVEVLEYMALMGGAAQATDVASAVFPNQTDDFFRYDWQNRWKFGRERNAIDRLLGKGILYVLWHGFGYNLYLVVPGDLLRVLTGSEDADFWTSPPVSPQPLAPPPAVMHHVGLLRDTVTLLGFLATQEAVRTNTGHIHKTALKNLARSLQNTDERYAAFLYAVCREAGLITTQERGEKLVYTATTKGMSWLHWDAMAQQRTLFEAWRGGVTWAEMYSDPLRKNEDFRPAEAILRIRHTVLGVLAETAAEAFYDLASLTDTLTFRAPMLLAQSAMLGANIVASPAVFVRLLVSECLAWLGAVEIGRAELPIEAVPPTAKKPAVKSGRGEPAAPPAHLDVTAYRLTPLGKYLLGIPGAEPPDTPPREDKFIVQANGEIFVSPYLEPALLYRLLALTDAPAKNATGNTVSLTRDSIRRSLDAGETGRDLLSFLQTHSRTGIPQNVEYLINEVGGKHGHIRIGRAQMYVQVDSPLLLQELQARRELKPYFDRVLDDTVALLKTDDPEKMLRELRKAGYMPTTDDAPKARPVRMDGRHTPPEPPAPAPEDVPESDAKRAKKLDTALDWNRIAQDDGQSWNGEKPAKAVRTRYLFGSRAED